MATQQKPPGTVAFGFGQIENLTPIHVKNARKAMNFFSGGVVTFLPAIAGWIHTTTDNLATIMGIVICFRLNTKH